MKQFIEKSKKELKQFFATPRGFLSWLLANIIVSAVWYIPMIIGLLFNQEEMLALGIALFVAMWMPPPIESFIVAFLTALFYKTIFKEKKNGKITIRK